MKSLVSAAVHPDTAFSASRRPLVRLLGIAPAALLVSGMLAVWAGPLAGPVAAATGDWPQFQGGPTHIGYNATETTLSAANVAGLSRAWTGPGGGTPVVADGAVYVVDSAGYLDAYAAVQDATTGTANTGVPPSQMLSTGGNSIAWNSVGWNSVGWNSVGWNSVGWNSVGWNSVGWNSVGWNSDHWGN